MADHNATVEYAEMLQNQRDDECAIACGEDLEGDLCRQAARCTKNPGHTGFSKILDFRVDSIAHLLPPCIPKSDFVQTVADHAVRTVRLRVLSEPPQSPIHLASHGKVIRAIMQYGSGYLTNEFSDLTQLTPCPLETCPVSASPHNVVGPLYILTAAHIFENDTLARNTEVDFFYDDQNDKASMIVAYGHNETVRPLQIRLDTGLIECFIHDLDFLNTMDKKKKHYCQLFDDISSLTMQQQLTVDLTDKKECPENDGSLPHKEPIDVTNVKSGRIDDSKSLAVCVSHLHGMAKHVSFGSVKKENQLDWCNLCKGIGKAAREFGDDDTFYTQLNQNLESNDVSEKVMGILKNESVQKLVDSVTKVTNKTTKHNTDTAPTAVNEVISSQITQMPVLNRAVTVAFWNDPNYRSTIKQIEKLFQSSKPNRPDASNNIEKTDKDSGRATSDASTSAAHSASLSVSVPPCSDTTPIQLERSTSRNEKDKLNTKINTFIQGLIGEVGRQAGIPTVDMSLLNKTEYTVPTCNGSSGARVLCLNTREGKSTFAWHTHVASSKTKPGINLGGLAFSQELPSTMERTQEQSENAKSDTASSNDVKDTKGFVTDIDLD